MKRRALVAAGVVFAVAEVHAEPRLQTDLAPSVGVGADVGEKTRPLAEARVLYLTMAGVYGRVTTGPAAVGVEARPFAFPRLLGASDAGTWGDLVTGSLRLSVGAAFAKKGRALELGTGVDLPLGGYTGPYLALDGVYRLPQERLDGTGKGELRGVLSIGFRFAVLAHVVDAGDGTTR